MAIEMLTAGKPAVPRRALLYAVALLAFTIVLATQMTRSRAQKELGARLDAPSWRISFRPPLGFQQVDPVITPLGPSHAFVRRAPDGTKLVMEFLRLDTGHATDPIDACQLILQKYSAQRAQSKLSSSANTERRKLGRYPGVEIRDRQVNAVVRAAIIPERGTFAVVLSLADGPDFPDAYRLFDFACRSIEISGQ